MNGATPAVDERSAALGALSAGLAVAVIAALNHWPGLSALDAGDFVSASSDLGVPHATGFPLATALGNAAGTWLPFGNLAGRWALTSALLSGAAAAAFAWTFVRLGRLNAGAAAVAAAVALAFSWADTLVLHARVAEVYALNLALLGGALVCIERLSSTGDARWRAGLALCAGLGLANHTLFRLWLPLLLGAAVVEGRSSARRGWGGLLSLGALALFAYAYLAAAAGRGAEHNWGDPSTLGRWWAHVTARDIRTAFGDEMFAGWYPARVRGEALMGQVWSGLGLHTLLGAGGLWLCARRGGRLCGWIVAVWLLDLVYCVAINPMGIRDFQNGQALVLVLAASSGVVLGALAERVCASRPRAALALGPVLVFACAIGAGSGRFSDGARDWSAEDVVAIHFGYAAAESLTATVSDTTTAAALYADVVLDVRPDSAVVGRHLWTDGRAAAHSAERQPFGLASPGELAGWPNSGLGGGSPREAAVLTWSLPRRRVYWEASGTGDGLPRGLRLEHVWPMGFVVAADAPPRECEAGSRSLCAEESDARWGREARALAGADGYFYTRWIARQWGYRGARAFRSGEHAASGMWFERARSLAPDNPAWTTGVALSLANTGQLAEALAVQEVALAMNPLSLQASTNAAEFAEALGDAAAAERWRRHAARLEGAR